MCIFNGLLPVFPLQHNMQRVASVVQLTRFLETFFRTLDYTMGVKHGGLTAKHIRGFTTCVGLFAGRAASFCRPPPALVVVKGSPVCVCVCVCVCA